MRPSNIQETAAEVREFLKSLGVHLRQDWIAHCLGQRNALDGPQEAKEAIYGIFLSCDLREAGEACLPSGVGNLAKERIRNKVVVQVECSKDIAKNAEQREKTGGESSHHTLKMALGDGRQTVVGFEYRRIQGLPADPPPGLKLLLVEPWVRRGILLLSSDNTVVLGGEVSSLVKARDSAQSGAGNNGTGNTAATASDRNNQSAAGGNIANGNSQSATNGGRVIPRLSAGEGNGRQPNADTDSVDRRTGTNQSQGVDSDRRHAGIPGRSNVASSGIRQPAGSGVFNPYASAFSAASNPGARSAAVTTGGVGGECVGATPSRETLQRRSQEGEARVPAFRDIEDDEPQFEYFEEPDFGDDQLQDEPQQPPEEPMARDRSSITRREPSPRTPSASSNSAFPVSQASLSSALPPVTPRPKIVTARVQHDRLREEGKQGVRDSPGDGASGSDHGSEQRQKRSRTDFVSAGARRDSDASGSPSGPYTSLASLPGAASTGGVYRVKAVVSDTMGCKLRKKKYLLVIEIEDGTAVLRVRLSDQITLRLFTVDAREFKKIFQADRDRGLGIQARVEQEIRQMEGVMEIDFTPASTAASQSPAVPETPGPALSQGSGFGDVEWSLPVLTSVSPPTDGDCRQLLSRVQGFV